MTGSVSETEDREFLVYWRHGVVDRIHGPSIEAAFGQHWGHGALAAVDFYDEGPEQNWNWNADRHDWIPVVPALKEEAHGAQE